jgi:hypothetical protein
MLKRGRGRVGLTGVRLAAVRLGFGGGEQIWGEREIGELWGVIGAARGFSGRTIT